MVKDFKNSKAGDLIVISDVDLLIELSDEKGVGSMCNFLIKEKKEYVNLPYHYITLLLDHVGSDREYLLVGSIHGEVMDVKLFSRPDFFEPNTRNVLEQSDLSWLFDGEGYPSEIYSGEIVYKIKIQNEVYGHDVIHEWITQSPIVNYELLVIETGFTNHNGGWVEFYEGRIIPDKDVKFNN